MSALIAGLALAAGSVMLAARYYRRRKARRLLAGAGADTATERSR